MNRHTFSSKQNGLTLIELLIAMAIGLIVVIAATATLMLSQQGFRSVDAASQLRDNARFASEIVRRVILQAGYLGTEFSIQRGHGFNLGGSLEASPPNIQGINNSRFDKLPSITEKSSTPGEKNSDVLIVRYQPGDNSDMALIDCLGNSDNSTIKHSSERIGSIFHIQNSSLMCSRIAADGTLTGTAQPLIEGVESFQVLYGTYLVKANEEPENLPTDAVSQAPDAYLRADELIVDNNPSATLANWERVRSIRIGMILRSAENVATNESNTAEIFYPFGSSFMASDSDPGSQLSITPDGRLRQVVNFTVHLRNPQGTI